MDERNFTYMFYGLAVAWLIPMIFLISMMLREKRLQNELDRVKRMISDKDLPKISG